METRMSIICFVGRLWLLFSVIQISSGQFIKGGPNSGGSSSGYSHFQNEPLVTRTHYSQSQPPQASQRQCERPKEPEHGSVQCRLLNDKYTCTGECETGYKFPDGRETYILDCSKHTGQWTPYRNFPDCVGSYGGGGYSQSESQQGSRRSGYSQTSSSGSGSYSRSYSHSSSGQGSNFFGGGSHFDRYSSLTPGTGQGCSQLKSPNYGSKHCSMTNGQWTCTATCNPGYEFPDGNRQAILSCHDREGQWTPKSNFDDCRRGHGQETCGQPKPPMYGTHYCSMSNGQWTCQATCNPGYEFPDGSRQATSTCHDREGRWSPKKDFDSCRRSGSGIGGGSSIMESCGQPKPPMHGSHYCSMSNGLWTCRATCNPGYEFPDGTRQTTTSCHDRDGRWSPKKDFDDCRLLCHPPCENGGRCSVHNQCQCPETHRGNRCQYAKSLCDPKRMFFGSVYSDCQHYGEYTECKISCPPGMTFDPPSSSVYRCTVDGLWNPPTAPTCTMDSFCEQPPDPTNGHVTCQGNTEIMICTGTCPPGYVFKDGFSELAIQCVRRTGEWTPTVGFPDCEPVCSPECLNGGRCIGHNSCLCPKEYRGSRCEYAYSNCDGHDRFASVGWKCEMTQKETICNVSCPARNTKLQPSQPTTYICSVDGTWQPDLKPICVRGTSSSQYERYQNGQRDTGWKVNHGSSSNQINRHRQNLGGYRNHEEDQTNYDYAHVGQQPVDYDFGGQQQIGHEFGGQQTVDHNFQWQNQNGKEFGGQQSIDDDEDDDLHSGKQISEKPLQKVQKMYEEAQKRPEGNSLNIQDDRHKHGLEDFNVNLPPGKKEETGEEIDESFVLLDEDGREVINEIGVSTEISINLGDFSNKRKVSSFSGICSTWGFYHYRTFDGGVYTFPSTCWYNLVESDPSSDDLITISVKSECGKLHCSRIIGIQHNNIRYLLSYSNGLVRDEEQLPVPIQDENLVVAYVSRYLVAKTQFGYTIWINEENTVLIVAESYLKGQTTGMCGNYDGVFDPLFLSDKGPTPDIFAFTSSWKGEHPYGTCIEEEEQKQPCSSETREKRMESDKANLACAAFYDAQFEKCSKVLDVDVYYLQCQMDCCSKSSVEDCECTSLGEFVLECSRAGVDMSNGWRQPGLCPLVCNNGTEYNECGPPCPPTCADQEPVCNIQKCVDGCHCPEGTLLQDGQCIPVDECPCFHENQYYESGETIQEDCNTCVCQAGNWKCTDSICPSTCTVFGPHFTTFDGFAYDFHGKCSYYLVDSDNFSVKVDYSTNCREINVISGVCIKSITIHTPEEAEVKLKPSMEITVNGREMTSLPVIAPGIYIGQSTSKYIRAQLNNGLEILWDHFGQNIQVFAPKELFGSLRGLCGTFSKSRQDEFLTPEGDIETSTGAFVLKWQVEESCKDVEETTNLEGNEKACDTYPERRGVASEVCIILKGPVFTECHDLLDFGRYYADCMEDVCSCQDDPVTCSCLSLANFANACARKGKPIYWRQAVPECGMVCPPDQLYQACADPCSYSCGEIAHMHSKCKDICIEGCVCPPGQTLNEHRRCIPVSSCSCIHSGHYYPPDFQQRRGKEMCECSQGHWDCHEATAADLILTPPLNVARECDPSANEVATDCVSGCPLTCNNYHHHEPCTVSICYPGCRCQNGYVRNTNTGTCVEPHNCPCHHGGKNYKEGEQVTMDCNTCVCEGGSWICDLKSCPGICSSWGDSHFETFDGNLYDFEGACEYVLVKARISDNEVFSVVTQNVPCGLGAEANCGKAVSVTLGDTSVSLTRVHPIPSVPENSRLTVTPVGMFTLVESDIGISIQWDRNTRVYVTAQPIWKNKLRGLCGDFNSDASDDFRPPSGGIPLVLAKDFADSWRVHKFCKKAKPSQDACNKNPERRTWSRHRCGVLKSDLFKPCHYQVEVEDYYQRCVSDACACSTGGDCKCVCAVIATYALKCARSGVVIPWRSQDLCPVQCESCDRYSPCISLCQPVNCDTYLIPLESQSCSREYCVDGCEPKPCKPGQVHRSATNLTCIPEEMCDDKPCIVIDGVSYREGERIENPDVGDSCQSCYCKNGKVDCIGVPCTYSTLQPIPTFIEEEPCEFTGWTEWINSMDPDDNEGNDFENLEELVETHRIPCPLDHVRSIECRSVETQEPSEASGQNVTCNPSEGLSCRRKARTGDCDDYEIRVYCQCHEEATCPPEQEWEECAFDCENSCHSLSTDLKMNSLCTEGEKCASGCVKNPCQFPLVARDAETCVTSDQCTCKLETGYILAPGQVITNGCEKCQCLNNTLICSTTLECKQPENVLDELGPYSENVPYIEVVTLKPGAKPPKPATRIIGPTRRKPSTPSSRGLVLALTTPVCSYWSNWVNKAKPKKARKHGEKEDTRPYIVKQTEGFCKQGFITAIECRDVETDQDYTLTNEEKLLCSLNRGFLCQNRHQPDARCRDYKIRYFCSCDEEPTPVPLFIKTTTQAYIYPCSEFVPLIDGPNPLPDTYLKASSSISPNSGPDAARFNKKGFKGKAWTPAESNEKQFIEVDLGDVRGVYGISTKGKELSTEWVTSYQLLYSTDGASYSYYQEESDNNKVFRGNYDESTEVKHIFKRPFEAKLVRFEPLTWEKKISLRLELLGCSEALTTPEISFPEEEEEEGRMGNVLPIQPVTTTPSPKECLDPIDLENGALLDSQLSASSSYNSGFTPENARLGSDSAWVSAFADDDQYLQVDFLDEANVTGIITKGREDVPQWVTAYTLSHSNDGIIWNNVKDEDGSVKEFAANYDPFSEVTNELPATIRTRFLRIEPTKWKNWISIQIEILGCYRPKPCRDPMGIDEGVISNYQLTSSSKLSDQKSASHGRLSSVSSWTPAKNDKVQYLQIDLLEPVKITGIITKGDPEVQQWVKSYFVGYSNDSINWRKVENYGGKAKEFSGNSDQDSPVINLFPISVTSRYIRIVPLKWHRWTSLRVALLGCAKEQVCREPMGLENSVLPDSQITASSSLDWTTSPSHARISDKNGWVADPYDKEPFLQVDFIEPRNVSAVITKGIEPNDYWVKKYKIVHSDDGDKWVPVTDDSGDIIEFPGNNDGDSPVVNTFPEAISARYFRIIPLDYQKKAGLRLEMLGCYHPYLCQEPLGMESGAIYDFQITASSSLNPELSPVNSRLDSDTAWVPEPGDGEPHIQVDLIVPTNITGLMTRGRNDANEWVKTYEIAYSDDGEHWIDPDDLSGFVLQHKANYDNDSPVTNLFPDSIIARYLRIKPSRYEKRPGLRFEILGCFEEKVCMEPMGIENGLLPEGQITASSFKSPDTNPLKVRLNSETSWSASTTRDPQYLQIDFGDPRNISAVVTKGSGDKPEWVTAFQVAYSNDEDEWTVVKNDDEEPIEFPGNTDKDTPTINVLPETIEAQYIRIIPTDWTNWISLRCEILGCYHPFEPPVTTEIPNAILDEVVTFLPTEPTYVAACPNPMEVESSLLNDATIDASSSTLEGGPSRIRIGGWVPRVDDLHPVLLVELPEVKWLTSIYIQGREDEENWVTSLRVIGSQDNKTWLPVFGPDGHEILEGNDDQDSVVSHFFKTPMAVKYVKVIPETWHRWPSLRMDIKGCHFPEVETTVPPVPPILRLCPELALETELAEDCPTYCEPGLLCDGEKCVDPVDCSCVHDGRIFKVSDKIEDHSCRQCDCMLGGRSICKDKVCPECPEDERSILNEDCTCSCKACEENQKMCPSNHECIPKQRWCDGIVDCLDDETNCIYTTTEITTTELIPTVPPEPENATCDVMGKHIKTFDGQDITYDICHHVAMKDIANGAFNIRLNKDCNFRGDCRHWLEVKLKNRNIKVFSDLKVEFNGHNYTASQLPRLSKKAKNLVIRKAGDQITIKSLTKYYILTYDNKAHLKIEIPPTLMNRVGGLCGFYSGVPEDDQQKPDGKKAYTSQEFGDSWAVGDGEKDCIPLVCPHEVMARALDQCNKLRNEPFKECGKILSVDHFIEFCMSSTCECMLHKNNSDEKCQCDSFQTYAEACEDKLGPAAARNWRFMHECHTECPPGMEWNDCGPSCQLTCDSTSEATLEECSDKCVAGCFCPPGTVLNDDRCIPPEKCADQLCQGFGDPHFRTFDGLFFPFSAEGSYLIVGDKENDFVLNGFSKRCNIFSRITCLTGLEIIYKGHKVLMKKNKEVQVDGISIPMDKLPVHSNGMIILGYPGRTFIVSIPIMHLEARYYEENSGFSVKVPSKRYFNKTEGLCGNCNGKKDDELDNKPLSEFVCSFQVEGHTDECEKSMEELPESKERIPLCEKLEDPVFEACYPLVDIEIYIEACSFDAVHTGDQKVAFCKTAKEYARQCCQAGVGIEDWPEVFDCDVKCPGDMEYSQCREGCPQTCSSVKNESADSMCNQLKNDGCFCEEGKVLNDTICIDATLCDTCDEEGHVPGDEWKNGKCKTCHCRSDLTTECVVEVCPAKPICSTHETLAKVSHEKEESCCESYACVPKIQNCPTPVVPECKYGEIAKIKTRRDLCSEFECECDPVMCSPIIWPTDLEEGEVAEIVNDSCCRKVHVSCHRDSCPEKPECRKGLELIEIENECCTTYKCKPPKEFCVYTNKYKVTDGFEILLDKEETTPSLFKPGDEWKDGLCEKCECVESNGQHAPLCTVEQCPALESMPESKDYILEELKIPEKCCPEIVRRHCKDEEGNIYEAGAQWRNPDNPCVSYVCEPSEIEKIQKTKSLINCTECPKTATYFPPSKILGQCCGFCEVTKCEDGDEIYEIGGTWVNPDQPCRKAECVKEHGTVKTIYTKKSCPTIPKDCPEDKIVLDESGCCKICNATSEISCNSAPIPEEDTIGLFTIQDDSHGGICVNEKPVSNVLKCSGACHSQSYYSLEDGDFKDMCKCCKVNVTVNRTIELICPDRNYITKTFLQPETCQCSKCAPKTKPEIERYETKQKWEQSEISDSGQPKVFQHEKETRPFQPLELNKEVQQEEEEDYEDIILKEKPIQQQEEDDD